MVDLSYVSGHLTASDKAVRRALHQFVLPELARQGLFLPERSTRAGRTLQTLFVSGLHVVAGAFTDSNETALTGTIPTFRDEPPTDLAVVVLICAHSFLNSRTGWAEARTEIHAHTASSILNAVAPNGIVGPEMFDEGAGVAALPTLGTIDRPSWEPENGALHYTPAGGNHEKGSSGHEG